MCFRSETTLYGLLEAAEVKQKCVVEVNQNTYLWFKVFLLTAIQHMETHLYECTGTTHMSFTLTSKGLKKSGQNLLDPYTGMLLQSAFL